LFQKAAGVGDRDQDDGLPHRQQRAHEDGSSPTDLGSNYALNSTDNSRVDVDQRHHHDVHEHQPSQQLHDVSSQNPRMMSGVLQEGVANSWDDNHLDLDAELDSFLNDFTSTHEDDRNSTDDTDQQYSEVSLHQWIEKFVPSTPSSSSTTYEYVKSSLPLAIKLTECLISDPYIPLADIATANVRVQLRQTILSAHGTEGLDWEDLTEDNFMALLRDADDTKPTSNNETTEVIEGVQIVSSTGDGVTGDDKQHLSALGAIFYELFSREEPSFHKSKTTDSNNLSSVGSINLNDQGTTIRPTKRSQRRVSDSSDAIQIESIARLEYLGVPQSLCALVKNLLDCYRGDLSGNDAYKSMEDVRFDLQLMLDRPSRFLDNIQPLSQPSFSTSDRLYGRDDNIASMKDAYNQHLTGDDCRGVVVMGEAGVGKSCLVSRVATYLSLEGQGYLLSCKWDQNLEITPLAVVGSAFNRLCQLFARCATSSQQAAVATELHMTLGSQAALLLAIVPCLSQIMAVSYSNNDASLVCVDPAKSLRFMCCNLLNILSNHLPRIVFWLDDIQWSDSTSLQLVGGLLADCEVSNKVFYVVSYRDDEMKDDSPFNSWLTSIPQHTLRRIHVTNLNEDDVNTLVSDALQLFPRLTRPLSLILHHKTRGNPLFLSQLLASLREEGYLYLSLNPCRWVWDIDKIFDLQIADNVLALLMREMGKLSDNLQLGLKVASCMGSFVKKSTLSILASVVGVELHEVLEEISRKGFMDETEDRYRFSHDRVQQAAYDLMSPYERQAQHMRLGVTMCTHSISNNDMGEVFFMALNQINRGGPHLLSDPNQRNTISSLNLKAGKRCIEICDHDSAMKFYESGISFLNPGHWQHQYKCSLKLFEAMVDVACTLNDAELFNRLSNELLLHARTYEDKLHTLCLSVRHLTLSKRVQEAADLAYEVLKRLGEDLPRSYGDIQLLTDIYAMKSKLSTMSDGYLLSLRQTSSRPKKTIFLMRLYSELMIVLSVSSRPFTFIVSFLLSQLTAICVASLAYRAFACRFY
jgi:predicted ATPase